MAVATTGHAPAAPERAPGGAWALDNRGSLRHGFGVLGNNADDVATRLYRLLRQHGDWPDDEVAAALDLKPERLEEAYAQLEKTGLGRRGTEGWTLADPMLGLEQVLADHARTMGEWADTAARLAGEADDVVTRMPMLRAAVDDAAVDTLLEGNEQARAFLAELGNSLRHELLSVQAGGALNQAAIDAALPHDLAVLGRGVEVRTIYQSSAIRSVATLTYLERLAEAGAQVRIRDTLPFRMLIADGATGVCSMKWAEGRSGAVVVRGAAFLHLMRRMFDFCWAEAVPLERAAGRVGQASGEGDLNDEQRLMVRLLADGATDQAIARQPGVAPRTFTRKLSALFELLGVESRFQAGIAASHLDLV